MLKKQGFTLIELLLVIAIIGILAGVILAVINPLQQQRKAQEGVIRSAVSKACLAVAGCNSASVTGTCAVPASEVNAANFAAGSPQGVQSVSITAATVSATSTWGCVISCTTATGVMTTGASCVTR